MKIEKPRDTEEIGSDSSQNVNQGKSAKAKHVITWTDKDSSQNLESQQTAITDTVSGAKGGKGKAKADDNYINTLKNIYEENKDQMQDISVKPSTTAKIKDAIGEAREHKLDSVNEEIGRLRKAIKELSKDAKKLDSLPEKLQRNFAEVVQSLISSVSPLREQALDGYGKKKGTEEKDASLQRLTDLTMIATNMGAELGHWDQIRTSRQALSNALNFVHPDYQPLATGLAKRATVVAEEYYHRLLEAYRTQIGSGLDREDDPGSRESVKPDQSGNAMGPLDLSNHPQETHYPQINSPELKARFDETCNWLQDQPGKLIRFWKGQIDSDLAMAHHNCKNFTRLLNISAGEIGVSVIDIQSQLQKPPSLFEYDKLQSHKSIEQAYKSIETELEKWFDQYYDLRREFCKQSNPQEERFPALQFQQGKHIRSVKYLFGILGTWYEQDMSLYHTVRDFKQGLISSASSFNNLSRKKESHNEGSWQGIFDRMQESSENYKRQGEALKQYLADQGLLDEQPQH